MLKIPLLTLAFAILSAPRAYSGDLVVRQFCGLQTQDNPASIEDCAAQDALNVNVTPGGKVLYKRAGYGLFQTLTFSTSPVHGGYHFQTTAGNDVQLWGYDTRLASIVNDAAFVNIATGTFGATWQCTDTQGFAYCVTSSNDSPVRTDGTSSNTTYQTAIPTGTIVASTPSRLLIGAVPGALSTIYFSASNSFTNFTVALQPTDPFTIIITAPGSRLTQLGYYFGKVFWWKDQSFGYADCQNQFNCPITIVSNQIGTIDNSAAYWDGMLYFRGQDNHIYSYNGYTLSRISRVITPQITVANRRKANSWTQTTQSDWSSGGVLPVLQLSTSAVSGDVVPGSFTVTEVSGASGWSSGSNSNFAVGTSSLSLVINNSGTVNDAGFETLCATDWLNGNCTTTDPVDCTINPQAGSNFLIGIHSGTTVTEELQAIYTDGTTLQTTGALTQFNDCAWRQTTLTPSSTNLGKRVKFRFHPSTGSDVTSNSSYIWGGPISVYYASTRNLGLGTYFDFDSVTLGSSTISAGSFTSQIFDTRLTSATYSLTNFAWTVATSTPTFTLLTSTANPTNNWISTLTSSSTNAVGNRYARYVSSISAVGTDALTSITNVTILARSSGTYYSAVNNAPSLGSWGNLTVNDDASTGGSITYYTRASTNSFTVFSSTPAWVAQTKNTTVTASTGTYMQLKGDFTIAAATNVPTLNDFTFNWYEGNAVDKAYIHYFQDALWISVSSGSTTSNDVVYYFDLLNGGAWFPYNLNADGFLTENNQLYFGDSTAGKIHVFGGVTTDNGSAINSYWKSKELSGSDPTIDNQYDQADFVFGQSSTTITYTYTMNQSSSTSVSIPIYDANLSLVRRNFNLAPGKIGLFYNFKISESSSRAAWSLLMHHVKYTPLGWRPKSN